MEQGNLHSASEEKVFYVYGVPEDQQCFAMVKNFFRQDGAKEVSVLGNKVKVVVNGKESVKTMREKFPGFDHSDLFLIPELYKEVRVLTDGDWNEFKDQYCPNFKTILQEIGVKVSKTSEGVFLTGSLEDIHEASQIIKEKVDAEILKNILSTTDIDKDGTSMAKTKLHHDSEELKSARGTTLQGLPQIKSAGGSVVPNHAPESKCCVCLKPKKMSYLFTRSNCPHKCCALCMSEQCQPCTRSTKIESGSPSTSVLVQSPTGGKKQNDIEKRPESPEAIFSGNPKTMHSRRLRRSASVGYFGDTAVDIGDVDPKEGRSETRAKSSAASPTMDNQQSHLYGASSSSDREFLFHTPLSSIQVKIAQGDLTKQKTDAIVNPCNGLLMHMGGAAKAIADAAGRDLTDDCNKYIRKNRLLRTSEVMHSRSGRLNPPIKHVIHACRPVVKEYTDQRKFQDVLENTFFNCFEYANNDLHVDSLSVPTISSGTFGVPKDVVAQSTWNALMRFDDQMSKTSKTKCLKLICFINIDQESTNSLIQTFKKHWNFYLFEQKSKVDAAKSEGSSKSSSTLRRSNSLPRKRSLKDQESAGGDIDRGKSAASSSTTDSQQPEQDDNCCIFMNKIKDPKKLDCGHIFCKDCIDEAFTHQPKCPSCGRIFGLPKGNQPDGKMTVRREGSLDLEGYRDCGAIVIEYDIPGGIQTADHPNPGQKFRFTFQKAYLPGNAEGEEVCRLLEKAFAAKLIFTIGKCNTTGRDNVVWNDIHHKTSTEGEYGYPDPTYLQRVKDELAAKGITSDTAGGHP